jgi:hypothetical protein
MSPLGTPMKFEYFVFIGWFLGCPVWSLQPCERKFHSGLTQRGLPVDLGLWFLARFEGLSPPMMIGSHAPPLSRTAVTYGTQRFEFEIVALYETNWSACMCSAYLADVPIFLC